MKTKLIPLSIICLLGFFGCINNRSPIHPDPMQLKIIVDGGTVSTSGLDEEKESTKDKINKTMTVDSPELTLSRYCKLLGDTAYMKLTAISSYGCEDIWSDFKFIRKNNIKKLVVYMNNPGGNAFQGMGLTDELRLLKSLGIEVVMEGRSLIASAAVPVFVAGGTKGKRVVSKTTVFMIHPAGLWKGGFFVQKEELKDLESQAKMIRLLNDSYAEALAENSNLSKDAILDMLQRDNWITAEQALNMGFVDRIE